MDYKKQLSAMQLEKLKTVLFNWFSGSFFKMEWLTDF